MRICVEWIIYINMESRIKKLYIFSLSYIYNLIRFQNILRRKFITTFFYLINFMGIFNLAQPLLWYHKLSPSSPPTSMNPCHTHINQSGFTCWCQSRLQPPWANAQIVTSAVNNWSNFLCRVYMPFIIRAHQMTSPKEIWYDVIFNHLKSWS